MSSTSPVPEWHAALGVRPRRNPLNDLVGELAARFLSGTIPPGSKLPPERELAELFGVGRNNIREAMKALDVLGLVEVRQGDGSYLRSRATGLLPQVIEWGLLLGGPETADLVETRFHLEISVAELAAMRRTDDDLRLLEQRIAEMAVADDISEFATADAGFHVALAAATRNKVLEGLIYNLKSMLQVWVLRAIRHNGEREHTIQQHRAVLAAVVARNAPEAARAMREHMTAASHSLIASADHDEAAPGA